MSYKSICHQKFAPIQEFRIKDGILIKNKSKAVTTHNCIVKWCIKFQVGRSSKRLEMFASSFNNVQVYTSIFYFSSILFVSSLKSYLSPCFWVAFKMYFIKSFVSIPFSCFKRTHNLLTLFQLNSICFYFFTFSKIFSHKLFTFRKKCYTIFCVLVGILVFFLRDRKSVV